MQRFSSPAAQNTVNVTDEKTREVDYVLSPSSTLHMSFICATAYEKWIRKCVLLGLAWSCWVLVEISLFALNTWGVVFLLCFYSRG